MDDSDSWDWLFHILNLYEDWYNAKEGDLELIDVLVYEFDDIGNLLGLLLNSLIFIDLYLTIKNPF